MNLRAAVCARIRLPLVLPAAVVLWMSGAVAAGDEEPSRPLVNDRCPVMNEEFSSPSQHITFHGVAVRFCCGKCRRRFLDDPTPFLAHLPQLSPQAMQEIMAEAEEARVTRAEDAVDRWTRPLLLGAAGVVATWLIVRLVRRRAGMP